MNKPLKGILKFCLFAGTLASLFLIPWPLIKARLAPLPVTVEGQVDRAGDYGFDGIIVYVDKKGSKPKFYTSGYKNRQSQAPTDPEDLFKIGSVSKLYTALAIAKLVYQGRLSLDETLSDYFPELEGRIENMDEITVKMLVTHRSGIPDYTRTPDYWVHPKETDKERLALVLDQAGNFSPGRRFQYSNTNYLLLSKIIEKLTGQNKFHFIKKEILDPLGLKNTHGSIKEVDLEDVMSGYYIGYENDLKTDDNGGMLATAEDLGKFIRALNEGSVFSDEEEQAIYSSIYQYEHTGMIPGYQTIARYHKDMDAVLIQFTNTSNFEGYNWALSEIMYDRVLRILRRSHAFF